MPGTGRSNERVVLRGTRDGNGFRLELIALIENRTQSLVAQEPAGVTGEAAGDKQEWELTAGCRLPDGLGSLENAVVTADALFTHSGVARTIVQEKGGYYVLAVKGNQPGLHARIITRVEAGHPAAMPPFLGRRDREAARADRAAQHPACAGGPLPARHPAAHGTRGDPGDTSLATRAQTISPPQSPCSSAPHEKENALEQ